MARKKRRNRIGHITHREDYKAANAVEAGQTICLGLKGKEQDACMRGIIAVANELERQGFDLNVKDLERLRR